MNSRTESPDHSGPGTSLRGLLAVLMVVGALLVSGCANYETERGWSATRLGRIGAQIQQSPQQYRQILEKNQLSPAEFDRAIQQIASNPELAEEYSRAFMAELRQ